MKPTSLDPLGDEILKRLSSFPDASEIILRGYFALQHYAPYRTTHDIDAWWKTRASPAAERAIRTVMRDIAREREYELKERSFGETLSFELHKSSRKKFSFQIAVRTVALEDSVPSAWTPILIETLDDNIASKMNALVDRGAPRDFLDIHRVIRDGLASVPSCWDLWSKKNTGESVESAMENVRFHLESLEARRPLGKIRDTEEAERARDTRNWFREEFLPG